MADPSTSSSTEKGQPKQKLIISTKSYREIERNSSAIFSLASTSKGSLVASLSLLCNELLREICQQKVEKSSLDKLEFYLRDQRMREDGADSVVVLAKSIREIGRAFAGGEEDTAATPPISAQPSLDFGDDDDDMDIDFNEIFGKNVENGNAPVMLPMKPLSVDSNVRVGPVHKFRPITPDDEKSLDSSPPPSPTRVEFADVLKSNKRKRADSSYDSEEEEEEDFDDMEDDSTAFIPSARSAEASFQCFMCDTLFFANSQLNNHLVEYHRVKPIESMSYERDDKPEASPKTTSFSQDAPPKSTAIITSRPINGFQNTIRVSSTAVTLPGGIVKQYSSTSNANRAAAKAAAAAEAGILRPNQPMRPYSCRHCGVVLASQQMYASHVRYNHPKEKEADDEGTTPARKSSGGSKESVIVHLKNDDGTKAFKCRRCDKTFDSAQKVAGHARHCLLVSEGKARPANQGPIPTEDRPYTVYRCGLGSELARTCPYCGELLPSIRKVDKHVRLVHDGARHEVYGCTTCDRRFVTLGGIENHWMHYADCPNGVLSVHRDGNVTVADIGEMPPGVRKPKKIAKIEPLPELNDDDDPSVAIVNKILGIHGITKKSDVSTLETSHIDGHSSEDDGGMRAEFRDLIDPSRKRAVVSVKLIPCRLCKFVSRTRFGIDNHMADKHADELTEDELFSIQNGTNSKTRSGTGVR